MQTTTIIKNGFQRAFSTKDSSGKVRRFGCCDYHDDRGYHITHEEGKFFLIMEDSRDNGFAELARHELPGDTQVTNGYHDDEHGMWISLNERLAVIEKRNSAPISQ